jgi:hypothetical protein
MCNLKAYDQLQCKVVISDPVSEVAGACQHFVNPQDAFLGAISSTPFDTVSSAFLTKNTFYMKRLPVLKEI